MAFLSEFTGPPTLAIRYYRQGFQALVDLSLLSHTEQDMAIVKAAAEWTSFKLCQLLLSTGSSLDAAFQLRLHLNAFAKLQLLRSPLQWRHSEWLARQHLLFAQLLLAQRVRGALDLDPAMHLHRAATLTLRRRREFQVAAGVLPSLPVEQLLIPFAGFRLATSRFLGGFPFLESDTDRQSLALSLRGQELLQAFLARAEVATDHCGSALALLQQSMLTIEERFQRRRALVRSTMAEVEQLRGNSLAALEQLTPLASLQLAQGWVIPATDALRRLLLSARDAGRRRELVDFGFKLYGMRHGRLSSPDLIELHDEIFSALGDDLNSSDGLQHGIVEVLVNDEAPLLDVSATFATPAASVGETAELVLELRSRLVRSLQLSEIIVSYSDGQTRHKIVHCDLTDCCLHFDDAGAARCPLVLDPDRPLRVRAEFVVTPAHLGAFSERELFVSQLDVAVPLDRPAHDGNPRSTLDGSAPDLRRLHFRCTNLGATQLLARQTEGISPADVAKAHRPVRNCFLTVRRRTAKLELKLLPRVLLQGVVGRVDVELRTNGDDVFDGSFAFESSSAAPSNPVFWLPFGKIFYPLRETSETWSPISVKIPPIASNRAEVFPLFIRSVTPGSLTLRVTAKYLTGRFRNEVKTDCEAVLVVAEPVKVRFSITNFLGFPRGVSKDILASSVARGDIVTLTATVECPSELQHGVHVSKLELNFHSDSDSAFVLKGDSDMLCGGVGDLSPGEILAGCTQLLCVPSRHDDRPLLNGLRANRSGFIGSVAVEISQMGSTQNSYDLGLLENLPSAGAVDSGMSVSERGTMFFYIPPVNLVDTPFEVDFSYASCIVEGKSFPLIVSVNSKLNSIARVSMKLDLDSKFLVTGETLRAAEVLYVMFSISLRHLSCRSSPLEAANFTLPCYLLSPVFSLFLIYAYLGIPGVRIQSFWR